MSMTFEEFKALGKGDLIHKTVKFFGEPEQSLLFMVMSEPYLPAFASRTTWCVNVLRLDNNHKTYLSFDNSLTIVSKLEVK